MSVDVKGIQELIDYFDKIGNKSVPKKALKKAGEHVRKVEVEVAKSTHGKYSRKNAESGFNHIKSFPPRIRKGKGYIDIGLKDKGKKSNWGSIRGLYFNHYGFYHNGWHKEGTAENRIKKGQKKGKYIAGSRWMDTAYDKSSETAYKLLEEGLLEGLDL